MPAVAELRRDHPARAHRHQRQRAGGRLDDDLGAVVRRVRADGVRRYLQERLVRRRRVRTGGVARSGRGRYHLAGERRRRPARVRRRGVRPRGRRRLRGRRRRGRGGAAGDGERRVRRGAGTPARHRLDLVRAVRRRRRYRQRDGRRARLVQPRRAQRGGVEAERDRSTQARVRPAGGVHVEARRERRAGGAVVRSERQRRGAAGLRRGRGEDPHRHGDQAGPARHPPRQTAHCVVSAPHPRLSGITTRGRRAPSGGPTAGCPGDYPPWPFSGHRPWPARTGSWCPTGHCLTQRFAAWPADVLRPPGERRARAAASRPARRRSRRRGGRARTRAARRAARR